MTAVLPLFDAIDVRPPEAGPSAAEGRDPAQFPAALESELASDDRAPDEGAEEGALALRSRREAPPNRVRRGPSELDRFAVSLEFASASTQPTAAELTGEPPAAPIIDVPNELGSAVPADARTESAIAQLNEGAASVAPRIAESAPDAARPLASAVAQPAPEAARPLASATAERAPEAVRSIASAVAEPAPEAARPVAFAIAEGTPEAVPSVAPAAVDTLSKALRPRVSDADPDSPTRSASAGAEPDPRGERADSRVAEPAASRPASEARSGVGDGDVLPIQTAALPHRARRVAAGDPRREGPAQPVERAALETTARRIEAGPPAAARESAPHPGEPIPPHSRTASPTEDRTQAPIRHGIAPSPDLSRPPIEDGARIAAAPAAFHASLVASAAGREAPELAAIPALESVPAPTAPAAQPSVVSTGTPPATAAPESIPLHAEWLAARGGGSARLNLHPPELGQVQLRVLVRGKSVEIVIVAQEEAARAIAHEYRDHLAQALAGRELRMDHFEVRDFASDSTPAGRDGAHGESSQHEAHRGEERTPGAGGRSEGTRRSEATLGAGAVSTPEASRSASSQGVDLHI